MDAPELQPTGSFDWARIIDVIEFGTAEAMQKLDNKRRPAPRTIALVAYRLALWADPDGTNVRPGLGRIAVTCRIERQTAKKVMAILRALGLIKMVRRGGRKRATEYRLTTPTDLLDRVRVLSPTDIKKRIEAIGGDGEDDNEGGMRTPNETPSGVGCAPLKPDHEPDARGGMRTPDERTGVGCAQQQGWDALPPPTRDRPQQNLTDQNLTSVSTSPEPPPPNDHPDDPRRPTPEQVAALRASNRTRHHEEHT